MCKDNYTKHYTLTNNVTRVNPPREIDFIISEEEIINCGKLALPGEVGLDHSFIEISINGNKPEINNLN